MTNALLPNEQQKTGKRTTIVDDLRLVAQLSWSIGWIVAIPAVAFGFGGAYLDRLYGTTPLFILLGFAIAVTLSGIGLYRKLREILSR